MKRQKFWLCTPVILVMTLLLACAQGTTPSPTVAPKPSPTTSPSPTAKPTTKPAQTQTSALVSFAGKTITIIVAFGAGGGSDLQARIYARHLPKYLPGNPSVVVRNMPGGGGTIGANYTYTSKPDGLTIMFMGASQALAYTLGMGGVNFDLQKMTAFIGFGTTGVWYMRPGHIDKVEDLPKAKSLVFGGASGVIGWISAINMEALDNRFAKTVFAYPSDGDVRRALLSGEVQVAAESNAAYLASVDPLAKKGEIFPLFQWGITNEKGELVRHVSLPDMISAQEAYQKIYGKAPSGIAWDAFKTLLSVGYGKSRALLPPPGTPDNIIQTYWDACEKMVKDTEFNKEVTVLQGAVEVKAGPAWDKDLKANLKMDDKVRQYVRDTLEKKYNLTIQ
ncbi:MAG: hypothetical protein HYX90_11395 [Chloroflexi bacterium]|nr:hypothetical protein [Chloroflexota bacterium]